MATRNFIQKEAGTITYQLREKHDLRGEANTDNPALAVSIVGGRTVTAEELAKEIAASCTIKEADVAGVLTALSQRVQSTLLDGNRVVLNDLGAFIIGVRSKCFSQDAMAASDFSPSVSSARSYTPRADCGRHCRKRAQRLYLTRIPLQT